MIVIAIIVIGAIPLAYAVLRALFKNSILTTFGIIWLLAQSLIVYLSFYVEETGKMTMLFWAFPVAFTTVISGVQINSENLRFIRSKVKKDYILKRSPFFIR